MQGTKNATLKNKNKHERQSFSAKKGRNISKKCGNVSLPRGRFREGRQLTNILDVAGAREVLPELVEGHRHDSVRRIEGLLQRAKRKARVKHMLRRHPPAFYTRHKTCPTGALNLKKMGMLG